MTRLGTDRRVVRDAPLPKGIHAEVRTLTDPRFFHRGGPFALSDIARHIAAEPPDSASAAMMIDDIAPLESAGRGQLTVFFDARYLDMFLASEASAIVTNHDLARHAPHRSGLLFVPQPRLAYAQIGHLFYPGSPLVPGVSASALVDPSAAIGDGCQIDAGAVISHGVKIGQRCHIGCHAVLGPGVVVGDDCVIGANTAISHALVGDRVHVESCATVGSQGFGFVPAPTGLLRMLQLGRVVIEDDVEIGANCAIDRGATGDTVIGAGTVIDNLVQIGGARIAGKSGVMRDVAKGEAVGGYPAVPLRQWHKQNAALLRLFRRNAADA